MVGPIPHAICVNTVLGVQWTLLSKMKESDSTTQMDLRILLLSTGSRHQHRDFYILALKKKAGDLSEALENMSVDPCGEVKAFGGKRASGVFCYE